MRVNSHEQISIPPRVGIVDDDRAVLRLTQIRFEAAGLSCRGFASARAAYAELLIDPCDVLIIDWRLDDGDADYDCRDGVELYERLIVAGCTAPAILMSGGVDRQLIDRARQAGFQSVVDKSSEQCRHLVELVRQIHHGRARPATLAEAIG